MHRNWMTAVLAALLVAAPVWADGSNEKGSPGKGASTPAPSSKKEAAARDKEAAKPAAPAYAAEIEQLREMILEQSRQLQEQRERLNALTEELRATRSAATDAANRATEASTKAREAANASAEVRNTAVSLSSSVSTLKAENTALKEAVAAGNAQGEGKPAEAPTAIHIKGITLTPGGFFDASTVWRQRGLVADVNTPFNSVPFSGSSQAHLGEFNASGRATRITMLVEGKSGIVKMSGFYEADFLGAGTTSNNNQSNSYVFRQRQAWGQAALDNGWTFTGGQMWSLLTERKKGIENRTEAVTMTIDHQYNVGFSWARQYGFRITKNFNDKVWLGMSVESAQTILTAHGNTNNFLIAAAGVGGGLYNNQANYSFNLSPDFIFKAAFEPGWGHYEVFGLVELERARVFPCATASVAAPCSVNGTTTPSGIGAFNDVRVGGGFGANVRFPVVKSKKVEVGAHFFGGNGIGRYGTGGLPVATVRPNGTLSLLRNYQALGTLELHPNSMLDVYINFGAEYSARAAYTNAAGGAVGYGSPLFSNAGCNTETLPGNQNTPGSLGSCTGDTRALFEGTVGFWYRFYKGPKGILQWGPQYSYIERTTWVGASGTAGVGVSPKGTENMVLTSFRYVLP